MNTKKRGVEDPNVQGRNAPRRVVLLPWHVESRATPIAYQILDDDLVRLIQTMVRQVYSLIGQRHNKFPLLDLELTHLQDLIWCQSQERVYRTAVVDKAMSVMQKYHFSANGKPGRHMALGMAMDSTEIPLHVNPCTYRSWPSIQWVIPPRGWIPTTYPAQSNMPFTLPISLLPQDAIHFYLGYNQHLITFKEDGDRMVWVFCTVGSSRLSVWINRKGTCFLVPNCNAPPAFYRGVVLDGELVRTRDGGLAFDPFDILWKCGRSTGEYVATVRLQQNHILADEWNEYVSGGHAGNSGESKIRQEPYDHDLFTNFHRVHSHLVLRWKRFFMAKDVASLIRVMSRGVTECDGLISITEECPIKIGTCREWHKIKWVNPLDLSAHLIKETETGCWFRLKCFDNFIHRNVEWTKNGDLFVPHESAALHRIAHVRAIHGHVVECKLVPTRSMNKTSPDESASGGVGNPMTLGWVLVRIRHDKLRTNNLETVQSTPVEGTKLSMIFPKSFFQQHECLPDSKEDPPSWTYLRCVDDGGEAWDRPCPRADSIRLPPIETFGVVPKHKLKRDYLIKCSTWSIEHRLETMNAHARASS